MCMVENAEKGVCLEQKSRVARKSHACFECQREIEKGETYHCEVVVHDHLARYRTCVHCQSVKEWLNTECGGYIFGDVAADIIEHAREYRSLSLYRVAVSMRRKWQTKRGLMPLPTILIRELPA